MANHKNQQQQHRRTRRSITIFSPFLAAAAAFCLISSFPSHSDAAPATSFTLKLSEYPPPSAVPPVDSPQVKKWLSEIDLSGAPSISLNSGEPPSCPDEVEEGVCYWTCDDCSADDVVDCPDKNTWGLTFDDGPTPATPELLRYLDEQKVKASFFLIGSNVVQYPDIVQAEVKAGHHLASHTWSHRALTTLSNEQIVAEMRWTEKAIEEATGYRVRYMRPPYGDVDNRVRFVLRKLGYTVVDWTGDTFDSEDWQIPELSMSQAIANFQHAISTYSSLANATTSSATETTINTSKGFISLEHDHTAETVSIAKTLIPFGMKHNLQIMSVAQCLHDNSPYAAVNGVPMAGSGSPTGNNAAPVAAPGTTKGNGNGDTTTNSLDGLDLNQHTNGAGGSAKSALTHHFMGQFSTSASSLSSALFLGTLVAGLVSL
ncbi:chitin deacetylase [Mortierella sp. AM989]|nr:chitin deacetylase [Mortierella sp. AM989]